MLATIVLLEGARLFFLCDRTLAIVITIGVVTIAICVWQVYVAAKSRRKWKALGLALPPIGLLMVLFTPTGPRVQAYFELVACLAANEVPRWQELDPAGRPVSQPLLRQAAQLAERILLDESRASGPSWSGAEQEWIRDAFARVPVWVDQRQSPADDSARLFRKRRSPKLELVAEVSQRSRKKICLYPDSLLDTFGTESLADSRDQRIYLAFVLIHEVCHIPRDCGGFLVNEVAGNPEKELPPEEHIGLHRWLADLALWCSLEPGFVESVRGARVFLRRQRTLLDPRRGAYGRVLDERRRHGELGQGGPPGPPQWNATPANWDGSNPVVD